MEYETSGSVLVPQVEHATRYELNSVKRAIHCSRTSKCFVQGRGRGNGAIERETLCCFVSCWVYLIGIVSTRSS